MQSGADKKLRRATQDISPHAQRAARRVASAQQEDPPAPTLIKGRSRKGTRVATEDLAGVAAAGAAEAVSVGTAATNAVADAGLSVGTPAASGGTSVTPSAITPVALLLDTERGLAAERGQAVEAAVAAPPVPATAAVIALVEGRGGGRTEEDAAAGAVSAGTSAAAGGVDTQEHGQAVGGKSGPRTGAASCAACGKLKETLRAQPAKRRPGAGLGPGSPRPLLGWLRQGQLPREPGCQLTSLGAATAPATTEQPSIT
ncbi:unnamed protein product [Closterium sp. Naga37s-1]|nr:unnamed protein product [Closterium sp. Naga37s-1]